MNLRLGFAAAALVAAAIAVGTAGANGSAFSPGLAYGWPGVAARGDGVRFVAFTMPRSTIVAAVRARDGRVLRSRVVRGPYGVPLVAYDGTAGGLSGDGRTLVLAAYGPLPGEAGRTRFVVLDTRTLRKRSTIVLAGSWSFDAIAPDASTLFFTEHLRAGERPLYRVRTFDRERGELLGAVVDRKAGGGQMGGVPVARATSSGGRWAYTLYARRDTVPFVHALDTVKREAYCIGIPVDLGYDAQWELRLRLGRGDGALELRRGRATLATLDTRTWKVSTAER